MTPIPLSSLTCSSAFRQVIVRRGDEAMAPGDLLPLTMPTNADAESEASDT